MPTRDNIRDAASTLAHLWCNGLSMDRCGVERCILSYPEAFRVVICARVLWHLEERGQYTQAALFEGLLFDLAGVAEDD